MSGGIRGLQTRSEAVTRLWQVRLLPSPPNHDAAGQGIAGLLLHSAEVLYEKYWLWSRF